MSNSISLIAILSLFTLLPFIIASGTYFIKFSSVFVIVRNALGLQQVPSNMTLNGVALLLSMFVMMPVGKEIYYNSQNENLSFNNVASVVNFVETGMSGYKSYLIKYGFAPIFPDTCYHLTHYWLAAVDIPVASDNPVHYADAIRYNARTPLQGSLLPLTRLVWA